MPEYCRICGAEAYLTELCHDCFNEITYETIVPFCEDADEQKETGR